MSLWLVYEPDGRCHQIISDEKPEGDTVKVSRHTLDPHCEHYDRKAKKWVEDNDKRAKHDEHIRRLTMTPADLMLLIEQLETRVQVLENKS